MGATETKKSRLIGSVAQAVRPGLLLAGFMLLLPAGASAQDHGLKLTIGDAGLGIGDVPVIDGLRLNFRDRYLERVRGVNVSIWAPHDDADGSIFGLGLGLPLTGAAHVTGLALGAGIAVEEDFTGIGLAPIGMGVGGRTRGIVIAGLGLGAGGDLDGLMVGGLGVGTGGDVHGAIIGGLGAGAGESVAGLAIGGLGLGVGDDLTGVAIGGLGVGVGGELTGLSITGIGVGASRITGLAVSGIGAAADEVTGVVLAPGYFRIEEGGALRGVSVSAFNHIRGRQHGLSIGLLNIAEELHGLQIGLINIARNKDSFPILPLVNYHP